MTCKGAGFLLPRREGLASTSNRAGKCFTIFNITCDVDCIYMYMYMQ